MDAVDLIKIDIEGGEALALAGMSAGLRRGRYRRLLLELHPVQLAEHGTSPGAIIEGLARDGLPWLGHCPLRRRGPPGCLCSGSSRRVVAAAAPVARGARHLAAPGFCPRRYFTCIPSTPRASGRLVSDEHPTLRIPIPGARRRGDRPRSNEDFEPILIVGHPRSGTTLLATILNRHSQVAIPPELSFFLPAHRRRRARRPGPALTRRCWIMRGRLPTAARSPMSRSRRCLSKARPSAGNLFRCMLVDYAAGPGRLVAAKSRRGTCWPFRS